MMSVDDLITGAMPGLQYSNPSSAVISTGVAPTGQYGQGPTGAPVAAGASLSAGGAMATATASGTAILLTWLVIVAILVATNVLTLRVQG
jgi:hypothetical protein